MQRSETRQRNGGDGNWNPFPNAINGVPSSVIPISTTQSMTIGGLKMTLLGTATEGDVALMAWGSNAKAIGIHSNNPTFGGTSSRIDGSAGEAISFWFDQPVLLNSIRLSGLPEDGTNPEIVTLTPDSGSTIEIENASTTVINTTDASLGDLFLAAGTMVTLTSDPSATFASGIQLSEITVSAVPEASLFGIWALGACLLSTSRRRRQSSSVGAVLRLCF